MRLGTLRRQDGSTVAARLESDTWVELAAPDVGALLASGGLADAARADGPRVPVDGAALAPVVPQPGKIFCTGLNYGNHIQEMGHAFPEYPTLFAKFADTLTGPYDDVPLPPQTDELDWEVELTVVLGAAVRHADDQQAADAIAGFTVLNDITCRDWQNRTGQWLQGKAWEGSTPLGPWLVTPDELPGEVRPRVRVSTTVDGVVRQDDNTADLVFDPVTLVRYVSTFITLRPGDIIATGTCGGVGAGMKPKVFLTAGQRVVTEIEGIGRLENRIVAG